MRPVVVLLAGLISALFAYSLKLDNALAKAEQRIEFLERVVKSETWKPQVVFTPFAPSGPCRLDKVLIITQNDGQFVCENQRIQSVEVAK